MILAVSLAAMPAMAEEEQEVNAAASEEVTEKEEVEEKVMAEETAVIGKTADKFPEVVEEAIEIVKVTAETAKDKAPTEMSAARLLMGYVNVIYTKVKQIWL